MPFNPSDMTEATLRRLVDNLVRHTKAKPLGEAPKRSQLQEALAATFGWPSYHAAITELKRKAEPSKASYDLPVDPSEPWVIPPFASELKDYIGNGWIEASGPSGRLQGIQGASLISASEAERKRLIQELVSLNPKKPVFVIRGAMSTIAPLPDASSLVVGFDINKAWENKTGFEMVEALRAVLSVDPTFADSLRLEKALSLFAQAIEKEFKDYSLAEIFPGGIAAGSLIIALRNGQPKDSEESTVLDRILRVIEKHVRSERWLSFPDDLAALAWVESKGSARAEFVVPNRPLVEEDHNKVLGVLEEWMAKHPDGLVLFDVPPLSSTLWGILSERFSHWVEAGRPLWVGITSEADVPEWCMKGLVPRFDRQLVSPVVAHRERRLWTR